MKTKPLVQNPDPQNTPFALISFAEDDPALPPPRGKVPKHKNPNSWEQIKMERTRALGGLVPERSPFLDRLARMIGELKHEEEDKSR